MSRRNLITTMMLCTLMMIGGVSFAQDGGGGGGERRRDQGGGGGGGGGGGRGEFRQRMMDQLKEQLGANEEEWKVLQPKIEKVDAARREVAVGRFGGGFGRRGGGGGGGGGGGAPQPAETVVGRAVQELRQTLENSGASVEEISSKLTALREARTKAQAELAASQKELKDVLTQRQEAVLVVNGMLE